MAQRPERTHLTGSTLVRLLAGLIDPQKRVRDSRMSFADALNQWTGWTDSIALSKALDRPLAVGAAVAGADPHGAEQAEFDRVRLLQAQTIAREVAGAGRGPLEAAMGFSPFRHCHQTRQQAMESAIGPLRDRVREAVAACPGEASRLAAVDAVMAQVLAVQERRLLATVTTMLGRHFIQLCGAQAADGADGAGADRAGDEARRDLFRQDLQAVLLAELELRLQPVQGLLAALRQHQPQGCS
ncbi:MAG: DUF3348 family protein [Comamonadaceae bacterium]|nr:MAG: DUF3348 family protein [Comamonadaceae bacterium]